MRWLRLVAGGGVAPEEHVASTPAVAFETTSGALRSELVVRDAAKQLAHGLWIALVNQDVRAELLHDLRASSYREQKIPLRRYLLGETGYGQQSSIVRSAIERALGGRQVLRTLLDNSIELALYIPVREQRRNYRGDANVIVAAGVRDHTAPDGYRLGGEPVQLSEHTPPVGVTVIAITAAEMKFDSPGLAVAHFEEGPPCDPETSIVECPTETSGSPPPRPTPTQSGVWMNQGYVDGSYESWFNGDPEFEVVLAFRAAGAVALSERQCAGEHASGPDQPGIAAADFVFDWQNPSSWIGLVKLATQGQFAQAQAADNGALLLMIEDDITSCRIKRSDDEVTSLVNSVSAAVDLEKSANKVNATSILNAVKLIGRIITLTGDLQSDDPIGLIVEKSVMPNCFVPSTFTHLIVGNSGSCRGYVNIVNVP